MAVKWLITMPIVICGWLSLQSGVKGYEIESFPYKGSNFPSMHLVKVETAEHRFYGIKVKLINLAEQLVSELKRRLSILYCMGGGKGSSPLFATCHFAHFWNQGSFCHFFATAAVSIFENQGLKWKKRQKVGCPLHYLKSSKSWSSDKKPIHRSTGNKNNLTRNGYIGGGI